MSGVGGRPTVMTEEVIAKLEEAFANGATDLQACFLANISKDSLYRYIQEHPEFSDRKEALKDMIAYRAKLKVKHDIESELGSKTAQWYLERKDKDFKNKTDLTSDGKSIMVNIDKDIAEKNNVADSEPKDNS